MKRWDESLPNNHHFVIGISGSGKTTFVKNHPLVRDAKRLLIWDPDGTYRVPHVQTIQQFHRVAVKNANFGPVRVALQCDPNISDFEKFCEITLALAHCKAPMTVVVEEAADVARVGKASPRWGMLSRRIRKYGGSIFLCSQRPQEVDKTYLGICGHIWCGIVDGRADAKYMANVLDVDAERVRALRQFEALYRQRPGAAVLLKPKS